MQHKLKIFDLLLQQYTLSILMLELTKFIVNAKTRNRANRGGIISNNYISLVELSENRIQTEKNQQAK